MDESKHANKHKNSTTDSVCDTPIKKQKHLHKAKISVLTSSQNKHKLDNADSLSLSSPFKRLKIDKEPQIESSSSRETRSKSSETLEKAIIFTKSVEEVLIRKIFDIGHRLNMTQLPECCLDPNKCRIDHETNVYELI